ncbi:MAG: metallophosphoesterase [Chitinophagaceae bacterium]|nr:metallophosphoesterase [Chitinophagaceae bacterium]
MRNSPFWKVLAGFMFLLDIYFFLSLQVVSAPVAPVVRIIIYSLYWAVSVSAIVLFWALPYIHIRHQTRLSKTTIFSIMAGLFFAKLVASLFFLGDDVYRMVHWARGEAVSKSFGMAWTGIIAGGSLFGILLYGFTNKYRYQVKRIKLTYDNLPAGFAGLKIVHISDIHSGSFTNKHAVMKGVQKILDEEPDLILFTGDMVNNVADEMKDYMDVFNKLSAPLGVYSTLGNHDYGDYVRWASAEAKEANLDRLKQVHHALGWRLLMNEHIVLEKGADKIALIGIENWSAKARFPKYGNLKKAYEGAESHPFKILLSHDPSHWRAEVLSDYPGIDLMLAGHTHGMQFGLEIPGFKWSPVQYVYKEWAGLYEKADQKLYINRGFGFIGYPGRSGILPEITVLELS